MGEVMMKIIGLKSVWILNEEAFQAFIEALDCPPVENEKLKKLLHQKAPWDK
jgi:uncharacterized protein (DUF1778 family)